MSLGRQRARSNIAEMYGWCKIRCRAFHVRSSDAKAITKVTVNVLMSCRCGRCWSRSTKRCRAVERSFNDRALADDRHPGIDVSSQRACGDIRVSCG